jgi:hypothetical protein
VSYVSRAITEEEYNAAVACSPGECPLFAAGCPATSALAARCAGACVYARASSDARRALARGRQLLEDLPVDLRLTFRRIAACLRPSPVTRRLAVALSAVGSRLERAALAARGALPPPCKRRRRCEQAGLRVDPVA